MAPEHKKTYLCLLLLIMGYLESLKSLVFYVFNLDNSRLEIIISIAVLAYFCVMPFMKSAVTRFLPGFLLFLTVILTAVSQGFNTFIFPAATCLYGLLGLLITGFILERKSAGEIFMLGILFEIAAVFTSDKGIMTYIIINLVFALALNIQLHFLQIENDRRIRFVDGSGINKNLIYTASLVILLSVSTVLTLYIKYGLMPENPLTFTLLSQTFLSQKAASGSVNDGLWGRLRNFEIDGRVPIDDTPVMQVKSTRPAYWRGETADFYTGRGWKNSMIVREAGDEDFSSPFQDGITVSKTEQIFSFYPGKGSQTVYSGGAPAGISQAADRSLPEAAENMRLLTDDGGNFYFAEPKPGFSYRTDTYVPEINGRKLADFSSNSSQSLSGVNIKYLQLPEIPPRVKSLAEKLTQSASGPYAKARKIEGFLSTNYFYDLTVTPLPDGRELTDFFLFDLKRGYCTYHSTAMVVMLRSIGIPARLVTGFTTGIYIPEKSAYEVKQSDAHAWVEAYIGGLGWIPFEPTASFTIPAANRSEPATVSVKAGQPSLKSSTKQVADRETGVSYPGIILACIITVTLILLITKIRKKNGYMGETQEFYNIFLQLVSQKGYYKDAAQTPFEFAIQLQRSGKFEDSFTEIMSITRAYEKFRFSPEALEPPEEKEITNILNTLALKLK